MRSPCGTSIPGSAHAKVRHAAEECVRIGSDEYALPCNYAIRLRRAHQQITAGSEAWIAAAAGSLLPEERNSQDLCRLPMR